MSEGSLRDARVLLVGCGRMGGALLHGWFDNGLAPANAWVVEPAVSSLKWAVERGAACVAEREKLPAGLKPDVIVLAVKPQAMAAVAPGYASMVRDGAAVLSIAAGTRIRAFTGFYGPEAAILRAMPNTPAAVGHGMSVLVASAAASAEQRALAEALLAAVGEVAWVDDEALMDAVTATSGSGPAYVFLLIEAMAAAGIAAGLKPALAQQLARQTVIGAAALADQSAEPASVLRENVTSPGGTTAAALEILMRDRGGLAELMRDAIAAAARRSRELAG
jgi:pyrroline-5-carboxylate reductase